MATGKDAILVALRSSTRKVAGLDNAVSVNPRTAGWTAYLGDVHIWNQNRAALTGLRKRGFSIERSRGEGSYSIYRIVSAPAAAAA
jgi:hypothetical protein